MFEIINWPEDMVPSRCPIHFTNELEVAASPETIWSLLTNTNAWPQFYPSIAQVHLLHGHQSLQMGTEFETSFAGQDVLASVQEFEPMKRIAWGGHPKVTEESRAYHAWIITPIPGGCHLWTEETMRGPYWIELAKAAPDGFWLAHERLLADLAKVATELELSVKSQNETAAGRKFL
ncbi:Polyketide cyclase / dehydrase and lipid transport [Pedobacter westerhofensis]|uniref:Polyketide cyclase / dehydrase and lipid transport n=1 Tax=Pedobacter westerhofensis TaxID=425512 RepID=A0A521FR29_9SPHI|nr:SRPBCC domain-containing protein [Pedobacter westerhofensis]SMO98659.1 Polyketide cyclase / dehydrase and lipid transport [Pedobacter westerhofensis]